MNRTSRGLKYPLELREFFPEQKPVRGRDNKESLKEFSKGLHAKADSDSGFTSKQKILLISGIGKNI